MARKPRPMKAAAFTLVEVGVAAAVLALGLVGMIQIVVSGSQMLDLARKQNIAMQIIHGQMDQIRLKTWPELNLYPYDRDQSVLVSAGDNAGLGFMFGSNLPAIAKGFRCTRSLSSVRTDLLQVTFTVTWTASTGRSYSRKGTTYLGKNGLYVSYQRS